MLATENYTTFSYSFPAAPPVVSDWPSRNGKPRVDLAQLHMKLAVLDSRQYHEPFDHSTDEITADTEAPLGRTDSIRSSSTHSEVVQQHRSSRRRLKRVRFSDAPPTVIVYEQVDVLEGEIVTRNMSLRRRNVDLSPVKNHKYEGKKL